MLDKVRKSVKFVGLALSFLGIAAGDAQALSLGPINVSSQLYEPLNATILMGLGSNEKFDVSCLSLRKPLQDTDYPPLSQASFKLEDRAQKRVIKLTHGEINLDEDVRTQLINISTELPVSDRILRVVVAVGCGYGVVRDYTVLLKSRDKPMASKSSDKSASVAAASPVSADSAAEQVGDEPRIAMVPTPNIARTVQKANRLPSLSKEESNDTIVQGDARIKPAPNNSGASTFDPNNKTVKPLVNQAAPKTGYPLSTVLDTSRIGKRSREEIEGLRQQQTTPDNSNLSTSDQAQQKKLADFIESGFKLKFSPTILDASRTNKRSEQEIDKLRLPMSTVGDVAAREQLKNEELTGFSDQEKFQPKSSSTSLDMSRIGKRSKEEVRKLREQQE